MPQLFSPAADFWIRIALCGLAGGLVLSVAAGMAVVRSSYVTGQDITPQQPVPFSHQHHVGDIGIDCRYCHTTVESARSAGMPTTETCMACHAHLFTGEAMLRPVRESWRDQVPLVWERVHDVPDFVYFNHSIHVHKGIGCYSCHGEVHAMPLVRQAKSLSMQWCLECHRNPQAHVRPRSLVFVTEPLERLVSEPLQPLRARLAKQYGLESKTDCYACHR